MSIRNHHDAQLDVSAWATITAVHRSRDALALEESIDESDSHNNAKTSAHRKMGLSSTVVVSLVDHMKGENVLAGL